MSNVTDQTILVSLAGYYSPKLYHNYDEKVINITVDIDVFSSTDIGYNYISRNLITVKVKNSYYILTCFDNFVLPKRFHFFKHIYDSLIAR